MNCQQFTSLIVESARGRLMDAAARDAAVRHAEACAACAARLSGEQRLTNALRSIAADMKDLCAPARVEAELLAAFREHRAAPQTATAGTTRAADTTSAGVRARASVATLPTPAQTNRMAAHSSSGRHSLRVLATAVAASLALVFLVTLYRQFTRNVTPTGTTATTGGATRTETKSDAAQPATTNNASDAPAVATTSHAQSPADPNVRSEVEGVRSTRRDATQRTHERMTRAAAPRMIASRQVIDGGRAIFAEDENARADNHAGGASKPAEAESVTEFIPLVADAPAAQPLESGQLVRVRLPRAALASLGLPLNAERSNEPVKADVLLGGDGLARAIRFVR